MVAVVVISGETIALKFGYIDREVTVALNLA